MATVLLAFVVLVMVVLGMAVGVLVKGKPIKGSCGGIAALGMGQACDICGGDQKKCDTEKKKLKTSPESANFYEAK